jgi:hypothetical protein
MKIRMRHSAAAALTAAAAVTIAATALLAAPAPSWAQGAPRDPWLRPFDSDSIWNRPIGQGAVYVDAGIGDAGFTSFDVEYLVKVAATDPFRTVYYPGSWTDRDSGTTVSWLGSMRVPDAFVVADATTNPYSTPNNASAFLQPNGHSLTQLEPVTRPTPGGPIWGYPNTGADLFQDGTYGVHFGSGLSAIGGSIRRGELLGGEPIRHALKIELYGARYYYYSAADATPGYRWPADRADSYAANNYRGTNPALKPGSLLALPKSVDIEALGLAAPQAKKVAKALQDYGAYIVDDAAWNAVYLCAEDGVGPEWSPSLSDINKIVAALKVVDNNGPNSVGGGGAVSSALVAPPIATALSNPGFESQQFWAQSPTGWGESGTVGASYTEGGRGTYSGGYNLLHYSGSAYQVYTFQTVNVPNGTYTLRARGYRSGAATAVYLEAADFGGTTPKRVTLPTLGANKTWQKIEITGISVTNGRVTVGLYSNAGAGAYARLDNVELLKQ